MSIRFMRRWPTLCDIWKYAVNNKDLKRYLLLHKRGVKNTKLCGKLPQTTRQHPSDACLIQFVKVNLRGINMICRNRKPFKTPKSGFEQSGSTGQRMERWIRRSTQIGTHLRVHSSSTGPNPAGGILCLVYNLAMEQLNNKTCDRGPSWLDWHRSD